jgi:hypothetical protein
MSPWGCSDHQDAWIQLVDYIIDTLDGVVLLSQRLAEQVLEAVSAIAKGIKGGRSVKEMFKKFRGRKDRETENHFVAFTCLMAII